MPGKHAPESPASFILSLSRAVGGALAAVAVMTILVVALLNRGSAEPQGQGPTVTSPSASPTRTMSSSPTPTVSATPTKAPLAPSRVTVQVLNGTARVGLAAATAEDIERAGYKIAGAPGNAASTAKSTIFYRKGRRAEALAFQASFPDFTVLREATGSQPGILRVVLGADWPEQT